MAQSAPLAPTPSARMTADAILGPERSLTVSFKASKLPSASLRLLPGDAWLEILDKAGLKVLSVVESGAAAPAAGVGGKKQSSRSCRRKNATNGITGFNMEGASLFISDKTFTLQARGQGQSPLDLVEPVLDVAFPNWRGKHPSQYLRYVHFNRLAVSASVGVQPRSEAIAHATWQQEVDRLNKYFDGEDVTLGSKTTATLGVYVASYLQKDDFPDSFSTQVALSEVFQHDADEKLLGASETLQAAWGELHGSEPLSVAAKPQLDTQRLPVGPEQLGGRTKSTLGVFGVYFTRSHAFSAQASPHAAEAETCDVPESGINIESSMPMTGERRVGFMSAASSVCRAGLLTVAEFSLNPALHAPGDAPAIAGFEVRQSSRTVGTYFACSLHHYVRSIAAALPLQMQARLAPSWQPASSSSVRAVETPAPVVEVEQIEQASLRAAEMYLKNNGFGTAKRTSVRVLTPEEEQAEAMAPPSDVPVALLDIGALRRQAQQWRQLLPRVEPFYAVKCNPHPKILEALWSSWREFGVGGFDCASPAEMKAVMALEPAVNLQDQVVYANPCKQETAVAFSRICGVKRTVFDNVAELDKILRLYPDADLLLRVQTDDSLAQCPLSNKFGCAPDQCARLLGQAMDRGLKVVGVSFHVGSGCSQAGAFRSALRRARDAFDEAERVGYEPRLLDIGGGFPGWDEENVATFADHAADISEVLQELFPSPDVRVIAEPGRFFAATAQALLTTVVSVADAAEGDRYYINDGLYGSFNCLLFDHAEVPRATILRNGRLLPPDEEGEHSKCTVFGPTCDGFDVVSENMPMPRLKVGDRLLFRDMGAYTNAASTSFNGFAPADAFVYESRHTCPIDRSVHVD